MPLTVAKRGDKFRVVEANTGRIAKNAAGTSYGGGDLTSKAEDRFWQKVTKQDGCWEWTAYRNSWGYGVFFT